MVSDEQKFDENQFEHFARQFQWNSGSVIVGVVFFIWFFQAIDFNYLEFVWKNVNFNAFIHRE